MNWWKSLFTRRQWSWVGTVEARSRGGMFIAVWNLFESFDGKRKAVVVVNTSYDMDGIPKVKASVQAWVMGGKLPPLIETAVPERKKPNLVSFPGGKDGAA